uniref:Uncharacterized protein n=1 Tax=viral metagenome TaxID=1070528 RepID=A0A2V0RAN0_9ZZZZ
MIVTTSAPMKFDDGTNKFIPGSYAMLLKDGTPGLVVGVDDVNDGQTEYLTAHVASVPSATDTTYTPVEPYVPASGYKRVSPQRVSPIMLYETFRAETPEDNIQGIEFAMTQFRTDSSRSGYDCLIQSLISSTSFRGPSIVRKIMGSEAWQRYVASPEEYANHLILLRILASGCGLPIESV